MRQHPHDVARRIWENRHGQRLQADDRLPLSYALKCLCQVCGRLLVFEADESHIPAARCCDRSYRLLTETVRVEVAVDNPEDELPLPRFIAPE